MASAIGSLVFKALTTFGVSSATASAYGVVVAGFLASPIGAVISTLAIDAGLRRVLRREPNDNADLRREVNFRSATETRVIVYGEALVGGNMVYGNLAGSENQNLFLVAGHCGHEVEDILDIQIYEELYGAANIDWGAGVTGGDFFVDGVSKARFDRFLGTPTQTASYLTTVFPSDFTTEHRGREIAYTITQLLLDEDSERSFEQGIPQSIRALIQGKLCYDPRVDSGGPGDNPDNVAFHRYTTNPIIQTSDYFRDKRLGYGFENNRINWTTVVHEANFCDQLVPNASGGYEKRFTSNGILSTMDSHRTNIMRLLSACNGRTSFKNGKLEIRAGRYGQGPNLATNGTFTGSISPFQNGDASRGTVTHNAVDDRMVVANAGGGGGRARGRYGINVTEGEVWQAKVNGVTRNNAAADYTLSISENADGSSPIESETKTSDHCSLEVEFTATVTGTMYAFFICESTVDGQQVEFDNVEIYQVLNEDDIVDESFLRGDIGIQTASPRGERFNAAKGFYYSPADKHKKVECLPVKNAAFESRDGEFISEAFDMPMSNSEDLSQRLLYKKIQRTDEMQVVTMPCNYKALNLAIHQCVKLNIAEYGFSGKVFRVTGWELRGSDDGIDLTLREDSVEAYRDPDENDYSERDSTGAVTPATPNVPAPTGVTLTAQSGIPTMTITLTLPSPRDYWDAVEIWRNTGPSFASATKVFDGVADEFIDPLVNSGQTYYYWARMRKGAEYSAEVATNPTNSITASIVADSILWSGVTGPGRPEDGATDGATAGDNLKTSVGAVLDDLEVINKAILAGGFVGENYNPYMDITRDDDTPAGWFIARQTGGPLPRDQLIDYADADKTQMRILSGSARPMVVTAAMPLKRGVWWLNHLRARAVGGSTTLNVHVFLHDDVDLGDGILTFATALAGADPEVGVADRENGNASGSFPASIQSTFGLGTTAIGWQWQELAGGTDITTIYDSAWISFGFQRDAAASDRNIIIDHFQVYTYPKGYSGSGAPP